MFDRRDAGEKSERKGSRQFLHSCLYKSPVAFYFKIFDESRTRSAAYFNWCEKNEASLCAADVTWSTVHKNLLEN